MKKNKFVSIRECTFRFNQLKEDIRDIKDNHLRSIWRKLDHLTIAVTALAVIIGAIKLIELLI